VSLKSTFSIKLFPWKCWVDLLTWNFCFQLNVVLRNLGHVVKRVGVRTMRQSCLEKQLWIGKHDSLSGCFFLFRWSLERKQQFLFRWELSDNGRTHFMEFTGSTGFGQCVWQSRFHSSQSCLRERWTKQPVHWSLQQHQSDSRYPWPTILSGSIVRSSLLHVTETFSSSCKSALWRF
jgi:hypothetical protein